MTKELYRKLQRMLEEKREGYISQRELKATKRILEKSGYKLRGPEGHFGGETGPYERHIVVYGRGDMIKDDLGNRKKIRNIHVFIISDPNDPRLHKEELDEDLHTRGRK